VDGVLIAGGFPSLNIEDDADLVTSRPLLEQATETDVQLTSRPVRFQWFVAR
jgi:hypothetical protein